MIYAVQALVGFQNAARRDTVMANVQTRLAQNVPWGTTTIFPRTLKESATPAFYCEVRFNTKTEQTSFWTDLLAAFGSGANGPVTGSKWWRHDCAHDGVGDCVIETQGGV